MDELLGHGISLFNAGEFFRCHEVLEEAWTGERGPRRMFLQALIHFAVGFYHCQKGNRLGAGRQLRKGLKKLAACLPSCEGIDTARLSREVLVVVDEIDAGAAAAYPRIHVCASNEAALTGD